MSSVSTISHEERLLSQCFSTNDIIFKMVYICESAINGRCFNEAIISHCRFKLAVKNMDVCCRSRGLVEPLIPYSSPSLIGFPHSTANSYLHLPVSTAEPLASHEPRLNFAQPPSEPFMSHMGLPVAPVQAMVCC